MADHVNHNSLAPKPMTDEELRQAAQWYADPIRRLPRKVRGDVPRLIATVRARRDQAEVARVREKIIDGLAVTLNRVVAERDALRAAARESIQHLYDSTSGAVCRPGSFPNHSHRVDGQWDDASKGACEECAAWKRLEAFVFTDERSGQ